MHEYIKSNAPETAFYEYQLWQSKENNAVLILKTTEIQDEIQMTERNIWVRTFFAINIEAANELKEHFLNK